MKKLLKLLAVALCICIVAFMLSGCEYVEDLLLGMNSGNQGNETETVEPGDGSSENLIGNNSQNKNEATEDTKGEDDTEDTKGEDDTEEEPAPPASNDGSSSQGSGSSEGSVGGESVPPVPQYYTITYVYGNGEDDKTVEYKADEISKPNDPERRNYIFLGWCKDSELSSYFDFDSTLTQNIKLYASWICDYQALTERVSREAMKFNVKIVADFYIIGSNTISSMQGSGAIYYLDENGYYYVLTNNHVADISEKYYKTEYIVYDMYGNEYAGELIANDASYDLAVLRFKKSDKVTLATASIRLGEHEEEALTVSLGAPRSQFNNLSFGKVLKHDIVNMGASSDPTSQITFTVIWHNSYVDHGSSGGALINEDLEIVGINYAAATDNEGDFSCGFAVDSLKIKEFLDANLLSYTALGGEVENDTVEGSGAETPAPETPESSENNGSTGETDL
ncbi:MAG: trypsin-like peptidase domain-containing protein [Clostridia bacterium]|nr:trypsin-like peptidase domain-containing protein [Clostridia bacterium]